MPTNKILKRRSKERRRKKRLFSCSIVFSSFLGLVGIVITAVEMLKLQDHLSGPIIIIGKIFVFDLHIQNAYVIMQWGNDFCAFQIGLYIEIYVMCRKYTKYHYIKVYIHVLYMF